MCMASAYLKRGSENELVLGDVAVLECEGDDLRLKPLFGAVKSIRGRIKEVDFLRSRILLEQRSAGEGKRE